MRGVNDEGKKRKRRKEKKGGLKNTWMEGYDGGVEVD